MFIGLAFYIWLFLQIGPLQQSFAHISTEPSGSNGSNLLSRFRLERKPLYTSSPDQTLIVHEETLMANNFRSLLPERADWVQEGPGTTCVEDGTLMLISFSAGPNYSPPSYLVLWNTQRIPGNFLLEFNMSCSNTEAASLILFFAASSNDNGSIFDLNQPLRAGKPANYSFGSLNCYAITFVCSEKKHNEIQLKIELWQNYGKQLLTSGTGVCFEKMSWPLSVRLLKLEERIQLEINKKQVLYWQATDDAADRMLDSGYIGFGAEKQNQMMKLSNMAMWHILEKK